MEVTDTLGQINTTVNTIVGGVGALATLASYYASLQLTLAVTAGVVVGTGLLLAFTLKEDRLDVKAPLSKRAPIAGSGEYFNQIELKFNPTLLLDNGLDPRRRSRSQSSPPPPPPGHPQVAAAEFITAHAGSGIPPRFRAPRG